MIKIEGVEKVEKALGKWVPNELAVIESFELVNTNCSDETELVASTLFQEKKNSWPNFDEKMFRVVISFVNVTGLSLRDFGGGKVQIMGFDIHFVGDRGLEGINYAIEDYEDNRIRFNCEKVHVLSVSPVLPNDQ